MSLSGFIQRDPKRAAELRPAPAKHTAAQIIWKLRDERRSSWMPAWYATCIALVEAAGSVLYACDQKPKSGHRARVTLFTT